MLSKSKNILFRADSSSTIGTGHIMRDLVLASEYKDSNIIFATQDLDGNLNDRIIEADYKLEILKSNSLKEVIGLVEKYSIDLVVIDHYSIDYKYEKELKKQTDVKILSFDDTYEKHYCDILLNHNIYANTKRYEGLVPKKCELRCGPEYTLLRDEFIKAKNKREKKVNGTNKTIFIAMGGADHSNINIKILKVLESFKNISVNIVTTTSNQYLKGLQVHVNERENVTLHINSTQIAKLMSEADFAILTPSVTLNEIMYMKVPFIAIKTALNQLYMMEYLELNNYFVLDEFNNKKLFQYISMMGVEVL